MRQSTKCEIQVNNKKQQVEVQGSPRPCQITLYINGSRFVLDTTSDGALIFPEEQVGSIKIGKRFGSGAIYIYPAERNKHNG